MKDTKKFFDTLRVVLSNPEVQRSELFDDVWSGMCDLERHIMGLERELESVTSIKILGEHYCGECGSKLIRSGQYFCSNCGHRIVWG